MHQLMAGNHATGMDSSLAHAMLKVNSEKITMPKEPTNLSAANAKRLKATAVFFK
jgi:hypothetical protein